MHFFKGNHSSTEDRYIHNKRLLEKKAPLILAGEVLSPEEFIRHLHFWENSTCHWGVDPENWRAYLHLSEEAYKGGKDGEAEEA